MSKIDRTPKPLPAPTEAEIAAFWSHIPDRQVGSCWIWKGRTRNGYGYIGLGKTDPSRDYRRGQFGAHRISYFLANGTDPFPLHALHRCDNPPCVNPDHLFLGTQADNDRDRDAKGRGNQAHGETHCRAKLSKEDIEEIRRKHVPWKVGYPALAKEFGVSRQTISQIIKGRAWKRTIALLPAPAKPSPAYPYIEKVHIDKRRLRGKLTESDVLEIRRRYQVGNISQPALAREFGVTQGAIGPIVRGKGWRHLITDCTDSASCK